MKLIALVPARNEEWILPAYLSSVTPVVDEIIAIDDGSTDGTRRLLEETGAIVESNQDPARVGWSEPEVRQRLLDLGRERGGTHFLFLDADEALTGPCVSNLRVAASELEPGQKLKMQWLALWKRADGYRDDKSVWSNNFKDFLVRDDPGLRFSGQWPHRIGRTPDGESTSLPLTIPASKGAVAHFQFVPWNYFQAKQAWYRCAELAAGLASPAEINRTYAPTLDDPSAKMTPLPSSWLSRISIPEGIEDLPADDYLDRLNELFNEHGLDFFEPLQIWHIPGLKERFEEEVGRSPKPKTRIGLAARLKSRASALRGS